MNVVTPFTWPRKLFTKDCLFAYGFLAPLDLLQFNEPSIRYVRDDFCASCWIVRCPEADGSVVCQEFRVLRDGYKPVARRFALEWAKQRYPGIEWVRTPFGSYVPREVAERVVAMMTEGKP